VSSGGKVFLDFQDTMPGIKGPTLKEIIVWYQWNTVDGGQGQAAITAEDVGRVHASHDIVYSQILVFLKCDVLRNLPVREKVFGKQCGDPGGIIIHVVPSAQQRSVCPWGESASEASFSLGA